jgi:hypothetical protein
MELEAPPAPDVDEGGRCLCGRDSTEGGNEDEALALQVQIYFHSSTSYLHLLHHIVDI